MKSFLRCAGTVLIFISLFTGCDAFVLLPAFNHNPDDPNQGFGPLRAGVVNDGTIRVMWDWYDLERVVRGAEPLYDKIVIKHSRGNYPDSRLGGKVFEIKNWDPGTNPLWATTFSDLKSDREHYFALYAHEKDGRWVGPLYTSRYIEGFELNPGVVFTLDTSNPSFGGSLSTSGINTPTTGAISADDVSIYYYEIGYEENIYSATINIPIGTAPTADDVLYIYPMRQGWSRNDTYDLRLIDGNEEFAFDRSILIEIPVLSTDSSVSADITSVISKSKYHHSNGILIKSESASMTIGDPTITSTVVWGY